MAGHEVQEAAADAAIGATGQGPPAARSAGMGEQVIQLHSVQDDTALVSLPLELVSVLQQALAPLSGLPVGDLQEQLRGVAQRLVRDAVPSGDQVAKPHGDADGGVGELGEAEATIAEVALPRSLPEISAELSRIPGTGVEELLPAGLDIGAVVGEADCGTLTTTQLSVMGSVILNKVALPATSFLTPPASLPEGLGTSRDAELFLEDLDIAADVEKGDCSMLTTTQLSVMSSIILSNVGLPTGVLSDTPATLMQQAQLSDAPYTAKQSAKTKLGFAQSGIRHTHFLSGLSMASAVPLKKLRGAASMSNLFPRLRGVANQSEQSRRRPFPPYGGATDVLESAHTTPALASTVPQRRPSRAAADEGFRTALTLEFSTGRSSSLNVLSVASPARLPVKSLFSSSQRALMHQQRGVTFAVTGTSIGIAGTSNLKPTAHVNAPLVGLAERVVSARRDLGGSKVAAIGELAAKEKSNALLVTSRADDPGVRRRRVVFANCVLPVSLSLRGLSISWRPAARARGLHSVRMERRVLRDRGRRTAGLMGAAYTERHQAGPSQSMRAPAQLSAVQPVQTVARAPSHVTRPARLRPADERLPRRQALSRSFIVSRMSAAQSRAKHMMRLRTLTSVPVFGGQTTIGDEPSGTEASIVLVQPRLPQDGDAPLVWWRGRARLVQPEQRTTGTMQASSTAASSALVQEPPLAASDLPEPAVPADVDVSSLRPGWGPNVPSPWRWQRGT